MIDVKNKRCIEPGCITMCKYNFPTEKKGIYCSEHKKETMINVISKRCIEPGCMTIPIYNFMNETKAIYCFEHKKDLMINVKSRRCIELGCNTLSNYNFQTEKRAIYCVKHKKETMIDVTHKRCIEPSCNSRPYYNFHTETKALYCFSHKEETMIDVSKKNCQHTKCKEKALFGEPNKRAQYCFEHKHFDMINVILDNKCCVLDCDNEYDHVIDLEKFCARHIPEDYGLIVKRTCKYCDIREESTHVCKECKKIQNKKEWAIVRLLRREIHTKFEYNSSKMLQGCSKKRPDIYFELAKQCVIVEIDENQHNTYEDSCECARLNEIVNGIGGRSVIVIRYNPDLARHNGKQIHLPQLERIEVLLQVVKDELLKEYDEFVVKVIQIYYNDNYEVYMPIKEEDITKLVCL
jgi:hypothetical protein